MAASASTFSQQWKPPRQVREAAPPHRTGTIRHVSGTGANAQVTVNLPGRAPVTFKPAQLVLL